ncbi:MAG TPA: LysR family transcriptional regulator [Stellaceae bacterium]|jgi:LysR family transcriptional regulator for metE and metH
MHNVTLKQLRAFAAVVRTGSVTGAARELNVSAPAVTLQMQLLQDQVGLPLVERSPAGMTATDTGREMLGAVERIEATLAECDAMLAGVAGAERGTVSVGVISTSKYFAPRALAAFARAHPGVDLRLSVGNRTQIIAGLSHYELDIAIMGRPPDEFAVDASVLGDHPHVIVAPPDHPLASQRSIDPACLSAETFIVREPGSGTRGLMERFFADSGVSPRFGMQIDSNETIKQAAIAGLGIAFISAHTVDAEIADERLVVLDIRGLPVIRQWFVVRLPGRRLLPAAAVLQKFLTEQGCSFLPDYDHHKSASGRRAG